MTWEGTKRKAHHHLDVGCESSYPQGTEKTESVSKSEKRIGTGTLSNKVLR